MTRRIALAVMALVTVLLVLAVVPLGLSLTGRERTSFRDSADAADRSLAAAAEERLSDRGSTDSLQNLLERVTEPSDCAAVFDASGHELAATTCPDQNAAESAASRREWAGLAREVIAHPGTVTREQDDRLAVAVTVGDHEHPVGATVLSRSAEPMNDRITTMWARLAVIGLGGLAAGALLAVRARTLGRPAAARRGHRGPGSG